MAVVPIIVPAHVHRRKRIVAAFRAAGATERGRATSLEKLALTDDSALRSLRSSAILRDAGDELLWLDEAAWTAREAQQARLALRIFVFMAALVSIALLILWLTVN